MADSHPSRELSDRDIVNETYRQNLGRINEPVQLILDKLVPLYGHSAVCFAIVKTRLYGGKTAKYVARVLETPPSSNGAGDHPGPQNKSRQPSGKCGRRNCCPAEKEQA